MISFGSEVFEQLIDGVLVLNKNGAPIFCNSSLATLLNMTQKQILRKKSLPEIFKTDSKELDLSLVANPGSSTSQTEIDFESATGRSGRIQISMRSLLDVKTDEQIIVIFFRDVDLEARLQRKYHAELKSKDRKITEITLLLDVAKALDKQIGKLEAMNKVLGLLALRGLFETIVLVEKNKKDQPRTVRVLTPEGMSDPREIKQWPSELLYDKSGNLPFTQTTQSDFFSLLKPHVDLKASKAGVAIHLRSRDIIWGDLLLFKKEDTVECQSEDISLTQSVVSQMALSLENAEFLERSIVDEMTQLYNRRHFDSRIKVEINRTVRGSAKPPTFALLMIDVDFFKKFNDTHGHQVGDLVLKHVAGVIKSVCRNYDTPARYGGEEFVLLLPHLNEKNALVVAERLRGLIEATQVPVGEKSLSVTVSIGVGLYPDHGTTEAGLIENADKALYQAKAEGRNRVVLFDPLKTKLKKTG